MNSVKKYIAFFSSSLEWPIPSRVTPSSSLSWGSLMAAHNSPLLPLLPSTYLLPLLLLFNPCLGFGVSSALSTYASSAVSYITSIGGGTDLFPQRFFWEEREVERYSRLTRPFPPHPAPIGHPPTTDRRRSTKNRGWGKEREAAAWREMRPLFHAPLLDQGEQAVVGG